MTSANKRILNAINQDEPKITETKEVEVPKILTEEESREKVVKESEDTFFENDEDIIEVNWD